MAPSLTPTSRKIGAAEVAPDTFVRINFSLIMSSGIVGLNLSSFQRHLSSKHRMLKTRIWHVHCTSLFYHANNQYLPIGVFKPAGLLFKILAWRGSEGGIANAKLAWFCIAAFGYVMKLCKVRKSMQSIFAPRDPWVLKRLTFKTEYMYNHYLLVTGRHLTIGVVLLNT